MKKFLSFLLALIMVLTFVTPALGTEAPRGLDSYDERAVSLVCVERTLEYIRYMTVDIGTRVGGMPNERRAIEWLIAEFDALGLETEIQYFQSFVSDPQALGYPIHGGHRNIAYITIHNAENFYEVGRFYQTLPDGTVRYGGPFMPWHGHTWEAGAALNALITETEDEVLHEPVTGEVVYVPNLAVVGETPEEIRDAFYARFVEAEVEGKVVLVRRLAAAQDVNIAIAAERAGAIGLMAHTSMGGRGNFGSATSPTFPAPADGPIGIPVTVIALAHGEWLKKMIEQEPVTVDLVTRRYYTPYSWNAIGRKPAVNNPENAPILYVVGHIDSVIGAPGANDNASGVAVTLEAARALVQLDTPDVELRFVGFGHEEGPGGLRGAWKYVGHLTPEEGRRIMGVFNMDMTASSDVEYATYWTMATVDGVPNVVTQVFMETAERLGYGGILEQSQFGSSDHVPFHNAINPAPAWAVGDWTRHPQRIPAAMGIWMGREHDGMITPNNMSIERFYHTPQDTIEENICLDRLQMCIRIVTAAVYQMARNPELPLDFEYHRAYMVGSAGYFRPTNNMTRAEAATIMVRTQVEGFRAGTYPAGMESFDAFTDVTKGDWFYYYVAWAYDAGLVGGHGGGVFAPGNNISREEFALLIARVDGVQPAGVLSFIDAANISEWALDGVYTAYLLGWVAGDATGTFRPEDFIMRAEAATAFNRIMGRVDSNAAYAAVDLVNEVALTSWPDVAATAWYYASVVAATNDHRLARDDDGAVIRMVFLW